MMHWVIRIIFALWLIRETKNLLFWLYLWQLKEYRWGRFSAHFRTSKGKSILKDKKQWLKLLLVPLLFLPIGIFYGVVVIIGLLYLAESGKTIIDLFRKKLRVPVMTAKTWFLVGLSAIVEVILGVALLMNFSTKFILVGLVIFDLLTPLIITILVWIIKPLVSLAKERVFSKALRKRENLDELMVIGITGSYGKTSTKEFLAEILSEKYNIAKTSEHVNTEIGVAQTILENVKDEHEIFVAEVGAYQKGEIEHTCSFLKPHIGVLTGINEQHLATFGSQQNIIEGKYELIEALPKDGLSVFNGYNDYCKKLYDKTDNPKRIIGPEGDLDIKNVNVKKQSVSFEIVSGENKAQFELSLLGEAPIQNFLLAVEVARELGFNLKEIAEIIDKKELEGAQSLNQNNFNVIDSTYSGNPNSIIAHLNYLKTWDGKKVLVMPCLIELGEAAPEVHKRIGKEIAEVCDLAVFTTGDYFEEVRQEALKNGMNNNQISLIRNSKQAFERIENYNGEEDIILLESRVPEELKEKLV
ncbi:MAG: UDP-N-acetylmuramoyl-tripeptide--D-alanyl-D-alanine ligase [Candidatus Paceibacterota bacterium]